MRSPLLLAGLAPAASASSPLLPSDVTNDVLQSIVGAESIGANGTAVNSTAASLQSKAALMSAEKPAEKSAAQKLADFKRAAEETWLNKEKAVK